MLYSMINRCHTPSQLLNYVGFVIQKLCMVACRWWGQNNSFYGKYELNRLQHSSYKRNICIWSCRASISLKLLLKRLVSWPSLLSICESWHRTICMLDFDKLCGCSTTLLFLWNKNQFLSSSWLNLIFQMILKMICSLLAMILQSFGVYGEGKFEWKYG